MSTNRLTDLFEVSTDSEQVLLAQR